MIEEEERNLAAEVVVHPCKSFGRTVNQPEVVVAVAVPGTAFCMPLPSSRERLHQICQERYQGTEDREHQRQVVDCVQAVRDWEIDLHQHRYRRILDEAKEVVDLIAVAVVQPAR